MCHVYAQEVDTSVSAMRAHGGKASSSSGKGVKGSSPPISRVGPEWLLLVLTGSFVQEQPVP